MEQEVIEAGDMVGIYNETEQVWCSKCGKPPSIEEPFCLLCTRF